MSKRGQYKILVPEANCIVRIDLENLSHICWLARRWVEGESQATLAREIGTQPAALCNRFARMIWELCPEDIVEEERYVTNVFGKRFDYVVRHIPTYGDERKPLMRKAIQRYAALMKEIF